MSASSDPPSFAPAPPLPGAFFAGNRDRLMARLASLGGAAVVPAAPELTRSRDTELRYRAAPDLYYLTGLEEPDVVAVLAPEHADARFTLFVRPRDAEREAWSGRRLGLEGAAEVTGADAVHPIGELHARLPGLLGSAERIFYPFGHDPAMDRLLLGAVAAARRGRQRSGRGPRALEDLEPLVAEARRVKQPLELERMRVAAEISERAHRAGIALARPGVGEWEIEAAVDGAMRTLGAAGPAFATIVGSGANATVLHYTSNGRRAATGELVLVDAGAEWGMYCADVSRTFPVSGRFTPPQRELYELVLAAEEAAIAAAIPGAPVAAVHDAAVRVLAGGMLRLGLLEADGVDAAVEGGGYRRFFQHQTSHWIGLDVHDVGDYRRAGEPVPLQPGMVLTVEPGIYVPDSEDVPHQFRGIGIRIEDTVCVTASGPEPLTRGVPVQPEEIERLVASAPAPR